MGNSLIKYFGQTLIDLTNDTVTADKLLQGYTAHNKAGNAVTGTFDPTKGVHGQFAPTSTGNGVALSIPLSTWGGFTPSWFCVILNAALPSTKTGIILARFGSNGSTGSLTLYCSNSSGAVARSGSGAPFTVSGGVLTMHTPNTSTKYVQDNYRWIAIP